MSIVGMALADMDRYDWALVLSTYVVVLAALLLGAPLWIAVGGGFVPLTIIAIRCARRNLFGQPDISGRSATSCIGATGDEPDALVERATRAPLSPRPHAADRP